MRFLVARAWFRREELLKLTRYAIHFLGFRELVLLGGQVWPLGRIFRVQLKPFVETRLGIRADGFRWAFRLTDAAINAFVWINDEHVLALIETVDRTNLDAVRIFATNAIIGHDISHCPTPVANLLFEGTAYLS